MGGFEEISSACSHWVWKEMAFSYQLSMVEGTVSMDMLCRMRGEGILAEKNPISTFWSVMLVRKSSS